MYTNFVIKNSSLGGGGLHFKQVDIESRPPGFNTTLYPHLLVSARACSRSIDSLYAASAGRSAANHLHAAGAVLLVIVGQKDGQTD